jgi:hypothetical protein
MIAAGVENPSRETRGGRVQYRVATAIAIILTAFAALSSEDKSMAEHVEVAQQKLQEFERTHSLEALSNAVQALEAIEKTEPSQAPPLQVRSRGALAWITLFRHIDQYLDRNFDPNDLPNVSVIPQATSRGVKYPSGVNPSAISDAKARTKYKELLDQNRAKLERYNFQHQLRLLNERALEGFHEYAKYSFATTRAESAELLRILNGAPLGAARKKQLTELMSP